MKKMAFILSIVLAVSVLCTSVFAATPALSGLKSNGFPIIGDKGYTKHVIYSGLPQSGTEETLESGARFAAYPYGVNNLETKYNDGKITTLFKEGTASAATSDILETIFSGYPVTPSTHCGIVCYEWKVRFNTATPSKIMIQSRDTAGQWAVAKTPYVGLFGTGVDYTFGLIYNTVTGTYNITKDGVQLPDRSGNQYYGALGTNGLQAPNIEFTFKDVNASIDILDAKLTYYEKTGAYSKVLYNGIPETTASTTNTDGVTTLATNATVEDGKLVETTGAYTYMSYPINSVSMPNGGKLYWEYTISFTEKPSQVWINARNGSNWDIANNLISDWKLTAYANTEFRIGFEYDILTGDWAYYNNGYLMKNGKLSTPETGFTSTYMEIKGSATMKYTISNMKLVYTENYQLPSDKYLEGIDNSSKISWSQNAGMSFDAIRQSDTSLSNKVGKLVVSNSDETKDYFRMYYKFDETPTAATHPERLYFEFTGNFSATPAAFHIGANGEGGDGLYNALPVSLFGDSSKDYTVALVYTVATGEWYILVDGDTTGVAGKVSEEEAPNGLSDFYFQWRGADAADVFTVKDIRAGYATGTDSVGNITVSENVASADVYKAPYSLFGNDLSFVVAQYTGDRLVDIAITKCTVKYGENTVTTEIGDIADGASVKVFLWSDIDRFVSPLANSVTP